MIQAYQKQNNNNILKETNFSTGYLLNALQPRMITNSFLKKYPVRRKSEIKCDKYSQMVGKKIWVLPLSKSPIPIFLKCDRQAQLLISGGDDASPGQFPHMAALGWKISNEEISYLCAGSLISERWVLTSAHCTHGTFGSPEFVRLGTHQLKDIFSGETLKVKSIRRHPNYNPPAAYADIALIELERSIEFGPVIKPACLHTSYNTVRQFWVTGWGVTHYGGEYSSALLKARLHIINNLDCALMYKNSTAVPRGIVRSMLCAGDPRGGWKKDSCKGDSGSPLQNFDPVKCLFEIVGITSFGKLCAVANMPGVYTRVSHYIDWIEAIVWPESES